MNVLNEKYDRVKWFRCANILDKLARFYSILVNLPIEIYFLLKIEKSFLSFVS